MRQTIYRFHYFQNNGIRNHVQEIYLIQKIVLQIYEHDLYTLAEISQGVLKGLNSAKKRLIALHLRHVDVDTKLFLYLF